MNVSTGGPHILFFERDAQLTALLTSEFQLAGYECHAARTAVEVFDTIARFPVRILLVNLAQAAAGRREFWVALDTQRRGRGVQVFTYLCSNLAGYGSRDTDERGLGQLPDIEIDGMLGLMSLVDTIRERVPSMTSASSTQTRLPRTAPPSTPSPTVAPSSTNTSGYRTGPIADTPLSDMPRTATITASIATPPPSVQQSYSEKIRAVLYPTQRPTNAQAPVVQTDAIQPHQETERPVAYTYTPQQSAPQTRQDVQIAQDVPAYGESASTLQRLAYGQPPVERVNRESGLDQLSRMLQERTAPVSDESSPRYPVTNELPENSYAPSATQLATDSIGTQPLRAAPIEDLPTDRAKNGISVTDGSRRADGTTRTSYGQYTDTANTPLASISTVLNAPAPVSALPPSSTMTKATVPMPTVTPQQHLEEPDVQAQRPTSSGQTTQQEEQGTPVELDEAIRDEVLTDALASTEQQVKDEGEEEQDDETTASTLTIQRERHEQVPTQKLSEEQNTSVTSIAPNNAMLLDIVQSLPLMPSPPPQPATQTISGRTMRTLGSVLLEGHLVPQSRLEVAQNIQRMLRGVDLNYQLGEILLMFKLLTPDQLLAASLVSYGMISTQQISALGRIRQELHAVGLEYDLESLLILFRMITPEQLREVRTSWQG